MNASDQSTRTVESAIKYNTVVTQIDLADLDIKTYPTGPGGDPTVLGEDGFTYSASFMTAKELVDAQAKIDDNRHLTDTEESKCDSWHSVERGQVDW